MGNGDTWSWKVAKRELECNRLLRHLWRHPHSQAHNPETDMHRRKTIMLSFALLSIVIAAVSVARFWTYSSCRPSSGEFQVYAVFLTRLAADRHLQPNELVIAHTTLQLSAPQSVSWTPLELRPNVMQPPPNFVSFCGQLCGHDFVGKNSSTWQLKPSGSDGFGISIGDVPKTPQTPKKHAVEVTRVGFNLWHTRAVLLYTADCNDYSMEFPTMCMEYGEAYLRKENGIWKVDHYRGTTF